MITVPILRDLYFSLSGRSFALHPGKLAKLNSVSECALDKRRPFILFPCPELHPNTSQAFQSLQQHTHVSSKASRLPFPFRALIQLFSVHLID